LPPRVGTDSTGGSTRAFIWTGRLDEEPHKTALDYHRAPVAGKIAIAPTTDLVNQRDLALANPEPEIRLEVARAARPDVVIATGRSDYPNQVNNVLCLPVESIWRRTFA